jgi:hypothetical protein
LVTQLPLEFLTEKLGMKWKKVFAFGFGSLFGVSALAGLAFWFLVIRAPSAQVQCDHLAELMRRENGVEPEASFRETCVSRLKRTSGEGLIFYADRSKCVIAAKSLDRAARCGAESAN